MSKFTPATASAPLLCVTLMALAGCATDTAFPSLAPRPIEAIARQPERVVTDAPRPKDAALDAQVAEIAQALDANEREWATAIASTRSTVDRARGRAVGDDLWVSAQQAISRLEPIRQVAGTLVETLDRLRVAQAQRPVLADTTRLDSVWQRAVAQAESQATAYQAIVNILPAG